MIMLTLKNDLTNMNLYNNPAHNKYLATSLTAITPFNMLKPAP